MNASLKTCSTPNFVINSELKIKHITQDMDLMHVEIINISYLLGVVTLIEVMIFQEILQKKTRSYGHTCMMQLN